MSDRLKLDAPFCECLVDVLEDLPDGRGQFRIVEPCWAHSKRLGPVGFLPGEVRDFMPRSPLALAVADAYDKESVNRA